MKHVIIVGTGYMALEYAKCLGYLNVPVYVLGRRELYRARFEKQGVRYVCGTVLSNSELFAAAQIVIVCCSIESNLSVLVDVGLVSSARIYLEKPGFLCSESWRDATDLLRQHDLWVVFNRRFFRLSEIFRQGIGDNPGGKLFVDISDDIRSIESTTKGTLVQQRWVVANSIHVIDLADWLTGGFDLLRASVKGGLACHPSGHIFNGEGLSDGSVSVHVMGEFSDRGRWKIAYETDQICFTLKPLEKLEIRDAVTGQSQVVVESEVDGLKPGLLEACRSMLSGHEDKRFCELNNLGRVISACEMVGGYTKAHDNDQV